VSGKISQIKKNLRILKKYLLESKIYTQCKQNVCCKLGYLNLITSDMRDNIIKG